MIEVETCLTCEGNGSLYGGGPITFTITNCYICKGAGKYEIKHTEGFYWLNDDIWALFKCKIGQNILRFSFTVEPYETILRY